MSSKIKAAFTFPTTKPATTEVPPSEKTEEQCLEERVVVDPPTTPAKAKPGSPCRNWQKEPNGSQGLNETPLESQRIEKLPEKYAEDLSKNIAQVFEMFQSLENSVTSLLVPSGTLR